MNKKLTLCLLLALKCSVSAQTPAFTWPSVALSGANAIVTGVYTLPDVSTNIWIRTDVGGVYRYDPTGHNGDGSWKPLTDSFELNYWPYFGCDGFAVNPADTKMIYYAGGRSGLGAILKSTDNGDHWRTTAVPTKSLVKNTINGNGDNRYAGERMAVSKRNPKYLVYGSRLTGAWYSTDYGDTWNESDAALMPTADDLKEDSGYTGVLCVAFDPSRDGRVYCAVSLHGVFYSDNNGATWTHVNGTSNSPQRLKVDRNGIVWYTTDYGVQKGSGASWAPSFKPTGAIAGDGVFCGLAINPSSPGEVVVQQGSQGLNADGKAMCKLWRTTDGGGTWNPIDYNYDPQASTNSFLVSQAGWYNKPSVYRFSPADLAFDPTIPSALWGGLWYCANINAKPHTTWTQREFNHEENVMRCLACPPLIGTGFTHYELLEGSMDDRGLAWISTYLTGIPDATLTSTPWEQDIKHIAFCEHDPSKMMRTGSQTRYGQNGLVVARSTDGGDTWNKVAFPANLLPMDLAVSSDASQNAVQNAVVVCHPKHTTDPSGRYWDETDPATGTAYPAVNSTNTIQVYYRDTSVNPPVWKWKAVTQTPVGSNPGLPMPPLLNMDARFAPIVLASDHLNGSYYYYLNMTASGSNPADARVFTSSDGGLTFHTATTATLPGGIAQYSLKSQPGAEGGVWVALDKYPDKNRNTDTEGLYHSTDYGKTFGRVDTVKRALCFGFGKPDVGAPAPVTLYIYGEIKTVPGVTGVYFSGDLGATWTSMYNETNQMSDGPTLMEGSRQTPRRVFVGTQGRGIFYSRPN